MKAFRTARRRSGLLAVAVMTVSVAAAAQQHGDAPTEQARAEGDRLIATLKRVIATVPLVDTAGVLQAFGFRAWDRTATENFVHVRPGGRDDHPGKVMVGTGFLSFALQPWMDQRGQNLLQFSSLAATVNTREACMTWSGVVGAFGEPVQVRPIVANDALWLAHSQPKGHAAFARQDAPLGKGLARLAVTFSDSHCASSFYVSYTLELQGN